MDRIITWYAISFFSLSFVPLVYLLPEGERRIPQNLIAACFWLFLILAIVEFKLCENKLYPVRQNLSRLGYRVRQKRDGLFRFSKRGNRRVLYVLCAAGLLMLVTDLLFGWLPGAWFFPILSLTLFGIAFHAVVDGRNYRTVQLFGKSLEDGKNETDA